MTCRKACTGTSVFIAAALTFGMLVSLLFPGVCCGAEGDTAADRENVTVHLFWGDGCPHCDKEKKFLETLKQKYPGLAVRDYEVWHNKANAALFEKVMNAGGIQAAAVPVTIVGNRLFLGFTGQIGRNIEKAVIACRERGCPDAVAGLLGRPDQKAPEEQKVTSLPFFGETDPAKISLPLLTLVIGGMDSFNPCAFFVLLFLLSLMIHTRSRKRMLFIGGVFVLFSGAIYFLFMAAWLNVFLIIGQLKAITVTAGGIALVAAAINIKDFFFFRKGVSLTIPEKSKPRLFERMRNLIKSPTVPAMAAGTIILAVTANAYELLCTAGFPMIYTRILTLHNLPPVWYYLYLALYNIVYVIPLAAIVLVVTVTLGARKLTEWQGRRLKLVSGLMMLFLGGILIVNPAILNSVAASALLLVSAVGVSAVTIYFARKINPDIAAG